MNVHPSIQPARYVRPPPLQMHLQVERSGTVDIRKGGVLCNLFYEPSTRTSTLFNAAMKRCGGEVIMSMLLPQCGKERHLHTQSVPPAVTRTRP